MPVPQNTHNVLSALFTCIAACEHCSSSNLRGEDLTMMATCVRNTIDCADICTITARFIARDSAHGIHLLKECIEVCEACAAECDRHADHHEHCRKCAEACRNCAAECRKALNA